jgi:Family of unknown function (DUF6290)
MTISLRLNEYLSRKLASLAKAKGISKSELIRQCLQDHLDKAEKAPTAWELGKHLFGCYKSGRGDLSVKAPQIVRARIHARRAKNNHR